MGLICCHKRGNIIMQYNANIENLKKKYKQYHGNRCQRFMLLLLKLVHG
jgi:hypothetical protein